jgi:hypothetical protein
MATAEQRAKEFWEQHLDKIVGVNLGRRGPVTEEERTADLVSAIRAAEADARREALDDAAKEADAVAQEWNEQAQAKASEGDYAAACRACYARDGAQETASQIRFLASRERP